MATHDITRHLLQPRKHYSSVRMQQRRTITDADFGEGEEIRAEVERRTLVDLIGESGSPDLGYRVDPGSLVTLPDDTIDFALSAGRFYVGGQALELFEDQRFRFQRDWLQHQSHYRLEFPTETRQDVVFVLAWQAVVTPVEDAELYEASLGPHVDASVRLRQFARVFALADVTGDDCDQAWADAAASLLADLCPGATLSSDGEVLSPIRLTVGFSGDTETEDPHAPCVDGPAGGYLAAENQAIRVMLVDDGTRYTWGFHNGSPLHRVRLSGSTVTLENPPDREELQLLRGQIVELLPLGALLDNGEKAAESIGFFTRVTRSYDARDATVELEAVPMAGTYVDDWSGHPDEEDLPGSAGSYSFMRVWNRGSDRTSDPVIELPVPGTPLVLGNTGLTVEFSELQGCPGDYWTIAARRDEPSRVVPWDLQDVTGAAPHGPRRFMAPLARIRWEVDAGSGNLSFDVIDCRPRFRALAERSVCCTFTVGQGAGSCEGGFSTIQAAIDALPTTGGTICVLPGVYPEHIRIDGRINVRIHGCGPRTRIVNPLGAGQIASRQEPPLVLVCNSQRVTIEDLAVEADGIVGIRVAHGTQKNALAPRALALRNLSITVREATVAGTTLEVSQARSALELFDAYAVRVEDCELHMNAPLSVFPAAFLLGTTVSLERCRVITRGTSIDAQPWGGVQVPGGASDVTISDCDIEGGLGHGITLGSVNYAPLSAAGLPATTQQFAVPVGVAAIQVDEGVGAVALFAQTLREDDTPYLPVPGPLVSRVRIVGNRIQGARTSGIAAAAFWPSASVEPSLASAISIADLRIEDNEIEGNGFVMPLVAQVAATMRIPGSGGIALPAVAGLRVVDNRIVGNGRTFVDPTVGLYVLEGAAIEISGNTIMGNGYRSSGSTVIRRGRRGGVVIMRAITQGGDFLSGDASLMEHLPAVPRHALVVRGNVIEQPEGKALYAPDLQGDALIEGNTLSSQGDDVPYVEAPEELQLEVSVLGTTAGTDRRARTGHGAVVHLRNNVRSLDAFPKSSLGQLGSRIGFNANQVFLDWLDPPFAGPQLCAVSIDALYDETGVTGGDDGAGDVSVVGNQFQAVMHGTDDPVVLRDPTRNLLLSQVIALGRSVRLVSNRIAAGRTDTMLSAFVWGAGVSPWGSLNVATHCIVGEPSGAPSAVLDNAILEPAGTSCNFLVAKSTGQRAWLVTEL
ncbi:DUF6519 domain-containing protein [Paraliomyxa miuraensis]|uniref:DUF6519 domain-containing protein n=1 Tax=Paraliomyxa miuraensis TaxID=376150 RepID=UPI00225398EC|nr:DUF6519 domain-containing protein [Paraliomyxa miuraensis]MCX4247456.1 DUF6519 domain-containing protein [Paraliomyxa miuraensis]